MSNFKNLLQRTFSGLIFIVITISSILYHPFSFGAVFLILTFLGLYEFYKLTNKPGDIEVNPIVGVFGGLILFASCFLHAYEKAPIYIFSVYAVYIILTFVSELFLKKVNPVNNWAYFFLGQVYIALPFSLLNYIIFTPGYQPWLLLAMFITLWINDTGAYVTGMLLGKHKMFERISPKKTWEGFAGGAFFALIAGYVFSRYIPDISLVQWLFFSVLVVIFGTLGDLSESLLKRAENVKDAGKLIPGHGGILDRFDSMLLSAPVILIYLTLILSL
ncbi:MAG: phosphatidate cytidylyltransferase [Paludibacteraceae bacterium]